MAKQQEVRTPDGRGGFNISYVDVPQKQQGCNHSTDVWQKIHESGSFGHRDGDPDVTTYRCTVCGEIHYVS